MFKKIKKTLTKIENVKNVKNVLRVKSHWVTRYVQASNALTVHE